MLAARRRIPCFQPNIVGINKKITKLINQLSICGLMTGKETTIQSEIVNAVNVL